MPIQKAWILPFVLSWSLLFGGALAHDDDGNTEAAIQKAMESIKAGDLKEYAMYLADDAREGRNAGQKGNNEAAQYIADLFKKFGLKPGGDDSDYFQKFSFKNRDGKGSANTQNVVALFEGTTAAKELIVLGAHYDHVGKTGQPNPGRLGKASGSDNIWNGADDNGSGTSTVIEVAQAFAESGIKTNRSVMFILFSGEEHGLLGSKHHASHMLSGYKYVAMINADMVGRNPDRPCGVHGTSTAQGSFWEDTVKKATGKTSLQVKFHSSHQISGGDSDHSSFIYKGIPAIFFFTGMHPDYHKPSDHPDRLAYDNMEKIGETLFLILVDLANGSTPTFKKPGR